MRGVHLAKTYFTWLVFFVWPGLLIGALLLWPALREAVPFLGLVAFFPGLFWINIPALWFGLARAMGQPHFTVEAFGAEPKTLFAWLGIFLFWAIVAAVMTGFTELVRRLYSRDQNLEVTPDRDENSLARLQESLRQ